LSATPPEKSWRERWINWRNRRIADPRFQRWAAAFPLTKPVADKNAKALFDVCAGFVYSQTLAAAAELTLFDFLAGGARDLSDIARHAALPDASALTLLRAGAALDLFEEVAPARFALGRGGAALLGNPGVLAMVAHHKALYTDLADPVRLLRDRSKDTALARYWRYPVAEDKAAIDPRDAAAYSELMAATQSFIAADVLDAYPLGRFKQLLDIGGGAGAFLCEALTRHPQLEGALFDLPAVTEIARKKIADAGLTKRVRIDSGDFYRVDVPKGADVASLIRILHDHDDDKARLILKAAFAALQPNGTLLIAEPMAETRGARAMGNAYFGLYLLAMGSGRPRSAAELTSMAREAGFRSAQILPSRRPLLVSVLAVKK
jgi:demethylspheroidene O-methyltransferase